MFAATKYKSNETLLFSFLHSICKFNIFTGKYRQKWQLSFVGKISVEQLKETPYRDWFEKQSMDHTSDLLPSDIKHLKDVTVKIYLGTWCGDTKYLLPRFIKTWEQLGLSEDQLELVALHHEGDLYKQAPDNETNGYNIHRVPTFIFERNGVEINRIVERTQFDLDTDIQSIAQGLPYKPRYKAVTIVNEIIENNPVDSLTSKSILNSTFNKIRREVSTSGELNTYG